MSTFANRSCLQCPAFASSVFGGCDLAAIGLLASARSELRLHAGDVIFLEGMPVTGIYCQRTGEAEVFQAGGPSEPRLAYRTGPGAVLGFKQLFDRSTYACSAVCVADAELCFIPLAAVMSLHESQPSVLFEMMKRLCSRLSALDDAPGDDAVSGALFDSLTLPAWRGR